MQPMFWKTLAALVLLCVLALHFGHQDWSQPFQKKHLAHLQAPVLSVSSHNESVAPGAWEYEWQRDRNNYSLSVSQCEAGFPRLYEDIDRAVQHWQTRNITSQSIELFHGQEGGVRVLFADQQLRVVQTRGMFRHDFHSRILAVLHQLQRAITSVEGVDVPFDDFEATIVVDDWPTFPRDGRELAVWSFARNSKRRDNDGVWLIPDFNFWSEKGKSFEEYQTQARVHDGSIATKEQKVVWRGVDWTNHEVRGALLNATLDQPWADVKSISWEGHADVLTQDEFCRYAYVVNTEGRSWSSRLTHLLNCDSVPIIHKMMWVAHYYHLLEPDVNFVSVSRNFSDLSERMAFYLTHPEDAQVIADKARTTFRERYTTPAATTCYWRKLVRGWSSVAFEPERLEAVGDDERGGERRVRGIAVEDFL